MPFGTLLSSFNSEFSIRGIIRGLAGRAFPKFQYPGHTPVHPKQNLLVWDLKNQSLQFLGIQCITLIKNC